ncbi:hypothetical protein TgHK011_004288 [Trichoderma gracile]|nr:hypothetical protein TgHK011_004288 [Trichoderma gracile]
MEPASYPQPTGVNNVMDENSPHVVPSISNTTPQQYRSGAFKLRTRVFFADDSLEQAEQAIFLFIFPDKVQHLSLHSISDPVQGGHTHVLRFDFISPPTFVSPTKKLDSSDSDSNKAIKIFSNLINLPTLDLPLDLATVSPLPSTGTAPTTQTNLAMLEDICKAFDNGSGVSSILSCLSASTLYNGKGGFPTTPTQFPDANPPDYASSRKRPASDSTASRPRQRPRLSGQAASPRPHTDQCQTGLDRFEELSRRLDTVAEQMESSRNSMYSRLRSLIESRSDMQSQRHRSLTDEVDAQRARFDVVLARSDTRLQSLTDQFDSMRAHAEARALQLQALGEEVRSDLSRRLDFLTGQIQSQNADFRRLTDSLAERVSYLEEDVRSTSDLARHNQRRLNSVEAELGILLSRIGRGDILIGEDLNHYPKKGARRSADASQDEI